MFSIILHFGLAPPFWFVISNKGYFSYTFPHVSQRQRAQIKLEVSGRRTHLFFSCTFSLLSVAWAALEKSLSHCLLISCNVSSPAPVARDCAIWRDGGWYQEVWTRKHAQRKHKHRRNSVPRTNPSRRKLRGTGMMSNELTAVLWTVIR